MTLLFIQTGGTIDKDYPQTTEGYAFEFGEPATRRILKKLKPSFDYDVVTACQKDSMELTEADRNELVELIQMTEYKKIIITHGTDTMIETARFLAERISDCLIILTGAMLPERFYDSDASINIGTAIGAANLLEPGVFISMHGIVRPWDEVKRDLETGQFY